MNLKNLNNLVEIKKLKEEPMNMSEFEGLLHAGETRFNDATKPDL